MPAKKSKPAGIKYQAPRYPAKVREAAAEFALATRARRKIGQLALGTPKSSKVHKDYVVVNRAYQATGRKLAKLTNQKWKVSRK